MTPDSTVQTAQEALSGPGSAPDTPQGAAVCLRAPRSGKLRVVWGGSDACCELLRSGWRVAYDVDLLGECGCGCGLPLPYDAASSTSSSLHPVLAGQLQKYADPEGCRKALYALMHPALDLSGMRPAAAKQAARMAEEAVKAAKLGQVRATVDARSEVEHAALRPDPRPSNRVRLSERHWQLLGEIKRLGFHSGSYSTIVMDLIEREAEDCRLRARQEGEHDGEFCS